MAEFSKDVGDVGFTAGPSGPRVDTSLADTITTAGDIGFELHKGSVTAGIESNIDKIKSQYDSDKVENAAFDDAKTQLLAGANLNDEKSLNRIAKEVRRIDKAKDAGLSASSALTRVNAKVKESLAAYPHLRTEIGNIFKKSSAGSASAFVSSLESTVKSEQALAVAQQKALEADMRKFYVDPRDLFAEAKYQKAVGEQRILDKIKTAGVIDTHKANQLLPVAMNRNLVAPIDQQVSQVMKTYGSIANVPAAEREKILNSLNSLEANAQSSIDAIVLQNNLSNVSKEKTGEYVTALKNYVSITRDTLLGKTKNELNTQIIQNFDDQAYIRLMAKRPETAAALSILKRAGQAAPGLTTQALGQQVGASIGAEFGLDKARNDSVTKFNTEINSKKPDNKKASFTLSEMQESYGDQQGVAEQKNIYSDVFKQLRGALQTGEDVNGNISLTEEAMKGLRNSPTEYHMFTYEAAIDFFGSKVFGSSGSKVEADKEFLQTSSKVLDAYGSEKLLPHMRAFIDKNQILRQATSGRGIDNLSLFEMADISVDEQGNIQLSLKADAKLPREAVARFEGTVIEFNNTYRNRVTNLLNAWENVAAANNEKAVSRQRIAEGLFAGILPLKAEQAPQEENNGLTEEEKIATPESSEPVFKSLTLETMKMFQKVYGDGGEALQLLLSDPRVKGKADRALQLWNAAQEAE